jgi:hypothetical protein
MGIKEVLGKFRDNVFEGLENQFEKLDDKMWDAAHNSYVNERLKEINAPKYVENLLKVLENSEISTEEKINCRKQIIINLGTVKEALNSPPTTYENSYVNFNENDGQCKLKMNYYGEGITTVKYIDKKLKQYGLDTSLTLLDSEIIAIGLKNKTEITIKMDDSNFKPKLDEVINNILQDLGVSLNIIEYQFARKRGPDYTKLFNNIPMNIADEPNVHPKKMRI